MYKKNVCNIARIGVSDKSQKIGFGAHVLLVDDEEYLLRLWKKVIERSGYRVTSYINGLLALEEFRAKPFSFDIVITDQVMPEITGCKLAEEISKIRSDIKIIMCSGYLGEMDLDNTLKISEYLMKPFEINALIEAIERNI